ncbi:MAG: hypothetical protein EXR69_10030 [Myxococcales bacterium]|nr:hypothetical protein [Myxococcales bacterium]
MIQVSSTTQSQCDTPKVAGPGAGVLALDARDFDIVDLTVGGTAGTLFDVYDDLGNWRTDGIVGEPVELDGNSVLYIELGG